MCIIANGKRKEDRIARFYDRVLEYGYVAPNIFKDKAEVLGEQFKDATVVDVSNVARYFYAGTDQEHWRVARDFPAIRSPFDVAWYEFHHNGFVRSEEHGDHWETPITTGFLVRVFERGDYRQAFDFDITEKYRADLGVDIDARWIMEALMFMEGEKNKPAYGPVAGWRFPVHHEGRACVRQEGEALFEVIPFIGNNEDYNQAIGRIIYPVLLAITFMHTTNVKQVNHAPPEKPNAKRLKSGRPPLTEYKTLELSLGAGKTTADFGASGRDYYGRKLHLVRGGFRNYTKERPLFGKHVGRWFWKPHVRGDAEVGEVKKDYKIGE